MKKWIEKKFYNLIPQTRCFEIDFDHSPQSNLFTIKQE